MINTHVLIIDDNKMGGEVLAHVLDSMGITYTVMQNSTAIDEIREYAPQLSAVFVDLEMPKIDGYEMLQILKNDLGLTVPVVAYTVHTSEIGTARELGFDSFLGKPLDLDYAVDHIRRILAGEAIWAVD
jgi:CheY-like chemotaxis protein